MARAWLRPMRSCAVAVLLLAGCAGPAAPDAARVADQPSRAMATVYGAAGRVSGSLAVLDTGNGRWMIDCGAEMLETTGPDSPPAQPPTAPPDSLPVDPKTITAAFITHAHTDHVGRLPLLVEGGFRGPIFLTPATAELLPVMLHMQVRYDRGRTRDWAWSRQSLERARAGGRLLSVHWHAACRYRAAIAPANLRSAQCSLDALADRFQREGQPVQVAPCQRCAEEEVAAIVACCRRVEYERPWEVARGVRVTLRDAGHIPGSASVLFEVTVEGRERRVLFSGDVGNDLSALFAGPRPAPAADAVFLETTYGPTLRDPSVLEERAEFRRAVGEAVRRGHVAWIPVFALDRTQKILYELHVAQRERLLPDGVPIYCASSTARELTVVYRKHQQAGWFREEVASDPEAWSPRGLRASASLPKNLPRPCVLLTTSGMMDQGWSRQMVDRLLPDEAVSVFLVGYQEPSSPGGLLKKAVGLMAEGTRDQAGRAPPAAKRPRDPVLELDGRRIAVRAAVRAYRCFSGHADAKEMDAWLARVPPNAPLILVHGGPWELSARAAQLRDRGRKRVVVAAPGRPIDLLE